MGSACNFESSRSAQFPPSITTPPALSMLPHSLLDIRLASTIYLALQVLRSVTLAVVPRAVFSLSQLPSSPRASSPRPARILEKVGNSILELGQVLPVLPMPNLSDLGPYLLAYCNLHHLKHDDPAMPDHPRSDLDQLGQ